MQVEDLNTKKPKYWKKKGLCKPDVYWVPHTPTVKWKCRICQMHRRVQILDLQFKNMFYNNRTYILDAAKWKCIEFVRRIVVYKF